MNNVIGKKCQDFFHIPEFVQLTKTPQSPIYHAEGDVATHTDMVCDALCQLPEWLLLTQQEQNILYYTALFHDIAKGFTLTWDGDIPRHPNHSMKGALWWRHYAWKNNIPVVIRENVTALILLHQKLFHIWNKDDYKRELFKYSSHIPLKFLVIFAKADILGRIAPDIQQHLETLSLVEIFAKENALWECKNALPPIERLEWLRHNRGDGFTSLHNGKGSIVHLMIGLPASGKDFFIKKALPNIPIISWDNKRLDLKLKYGENEGLVKQHVLRDVKMLLANKTPFIWNTTNTSFNTLEKTLELIYAYDGYIKAYVLNTNYNEQLKRNAQRQQSIPEKTILDMAQKWNIPSLNDVHEILFYDNGELIPELSSPLSFSVTAPSY